MDFRRERCGRLIRSPQIRPRIHPRTAGTIHPPHPLTCDCSMSGTPMISNHVHLHHSCSQNDRPQRRIPARDHVIRSTRDEARVDVCCALDQRPCCVHCVHCVHCTRCVTSVTCLFCHSMFL